MFVLVTFYQNVIRCTAFETLSISANITNPPSVPLFQTPGSDRLKSSPVLHFFSCWKSHFTWKMSYHRGKMCWLVMLTWKSQNQAWHVFFSVLQVSSSCVPVANYELVRTSVVVFGRFLEPSSHGICTVNQIDDKVMLVYFGGQNVSSHNR